MAKRPAFQFYPREYLTDEHVVLMSLEEQGAYVRLLCHQWLEGSVPSEIPELAKLCGVRPTTMRKIFAKISAKFVSTLDGRLVNSRLERARSETAEWVEKSRLGGVKSGEARRKGGSQMVATLVEPESNTVSVTASEQKKKKASPSQKKALPEEWAPNDAHRQQAVKLGVDIESEVAKFRDWARANGKTMLDWNAAFRNWLRNAKPTRRPANGKLGVTALDLRTLLFAGGEMLFNGYGRAAALVTIAERHPDIWARAGPVFEQLDFPSLARDRTNDFQLMRNLESQLATYRSNAA